jgi:hypothetical protein
MDASFVVLKAAKRKPKLVLMLKVMEEILIEAYSWCFDGSNCIITWPQQLALSCFYTAAVLGQKMHTFNLKKEPNTLKANFGYWKQFLTYCYRVAYYSSHFTTANNDQRTPKSCIWLTDAQEKAWKAAFQSAVK